MLAFERRVVGALTETADPSLRSEIEAWVEASLRDMPEFLRAGVVAESLALGAWAVLVRRPVDAIIVSLQESPVGLLRQYVRLFRSLVLFAELELERAAP